MCFVGWEGFLAPGLLVKFFGQKKGRISPRLRNTHVQDTTTDLDYENRQARLLHDQEDNKLKTCIVKKMSTRRFLTPPFSASLSETRSFEHGYRGFLILRDVR